MRIELLTGARGSATRFLRVRDRVEFLLPTPQTELILESASPGSPTAPRQPLHGDSIGCTRQCRLAQSKWPPKCARSSFLRED